MQAVYYRAANGDEQVRDFILALPARAKTAILVQISRLNTLEPGDPPLPFPYSSQVEGELRELRCHYGSSLFRVLYRRSENLFALLRAFEKRTGTVPRSEVELAARSWDDLNRRMRERPRRPPRALGHDAP